MCSEAEHRRPFRFHLHSVVTCLTVLCMWMGLLSWHETSVSTVGHFIMGLTLWAAAYRLDLPWLFVPGAIIYATGFIVMANGI